MEEVSGPPLKRQRGDENDDDDENDDHQLPTPTSTQLQPHSSFFLSSPTLQLTGHTGSVYALAYSANGHAMISASFDKTCLLWSCGNSGDDSSGESRGLYENYNVLSGHKNAVLDCCWLLEDNSRIVTCSADKTVQLWDAWTGQRVRKWQEHSAIVNAVCSSTSTAGTAASFAVSVGDDGRCCVWDVRQRRPAHIMRDDFPILAVAATTTQVFTGGIDNLVHCWDLKMTSSSSNSGGGRKLYSLKGHTDTITSLALHPQATHLLSNSMDRTLRSWDIRPFLADDKQQRRHTQTFVGQTHNAEKGLLKCAWSSDASMVSCGSADKRVHIWDVFSGQELYNLPGHKGCVNAVAFHPIQTNVIASGGSDKHIFVGELS